MHTLSENFNIPRVFTNFLDQHPEPYFIKDLNSVFIYANLSTAKLAGVRSPLDLLHKNENEIQSLLTENEDIVNLWQLQDKQVCTKRKRLNTLEVHPEAIDYPYIVRKLPFYDENNTCVGVICYSRTLESYTPNDFINGRRPGSLLLNKPDDFFTERECEIIFLKLQGQTCKNIGNMLFISPRTVESTLQRLYDKSGVSHFDDFAEFCEKRSYDRYLPGRFLDRKKIIMISVNGGIHKSFSRYTDAMSTELKSYTP